MSKIEHFIALIAECIKSLDNGPLVCSQLPRLGGSIFLTQFFMLCSSEQYLRKDAAFSHMATTRHLKDYSMHI